MNNKKKILITAPYFPPAGGGLERYVFEISKRLSNDNYDVVVITSGSRFGEDTLEHYENIKVYRLAFWFRISNTPFSCRWYKRIKKIVKEEKPDLVNIHMPVPGIGDMVNILTFNIPKIVTYHAGTLHKGVSLLSVVTTIYEKVFLKFLLNCTTFIITSSDYLRFGFLSKYQKKSITITPGVDEELFIKDLSKKNEDPTILFVATLGKSETYKGLESLIYSVDILKARIPNIVLNVVGDGSMREEYEELVKKLNLIENIKFWGRLNGERLAEKYKKSHLFVSASTKESFSMVILEAMSSSLPVIAFDVGSTSQMIEDGVNGYLLSCANKKMMTEKIYELLTDKEKAQKFGESGRKKVEDKFTWSKKYTEYKEVINRIVR